jgi:preprotein translocase subunit SecG
MLIVTIVHVVVCFALIMIVLLQAGKGAEMGAAFGGASQTLFGSSGAVGFLTKLTTIVAVVFMLTSLLLAFRSSGRSGSVVKEKPAQSAPAQAPAKAPAPPAAPTAPAQAPAPAPETKK